MSDPITFTDVDGDTVTFQTCLVGLTVRIHESEVYLTADEAVELVTWLAREFGPGVEQPRVNIYTAPDPERRFTERATAYRLAQDMVGTDADPVDVTMLADWLLDDTDTPIPLPVGPPPIDVDMLIREGVLTRSDGPMSPAFIPGADILLTCGHKHGDDTCTENAGHLDGSNPTPHYDERSAHSWQRS